MPLTAAIICRNAASYAPEITLIPVPVTAVASSATITVGGVNYLDHTSTAAYSDYTLAQAMPAFGTAWVASSETPAICTVTGDQITRVQDGLGKIRLTGPHGFSKFETVVFNSATPATRRVWTGLQAGSTSAQLADPLLALVGTTKTLNYYSSGIGRGASGPLVRNPNCWAASIDLTASAVATTLGGSYGTANSGALITRRHWLGVPHWSRGAENMGPGSIVTFTDLAGNRHPRTVLARQIHATRDLMCCVLNADLPAGVTPLLLPNANHRDATTGRVYGLGFQVTQEKNVSLVGYDAFSAGFLAPSPDLTGIRWDPIFDLKTDSAHRLYGLGNLMQMGRDGDSGGILCGLYAGQPFLVSLFTSATSGVYLPGIKSEIAALIASADAAAGISTGYAVGVLEIPAAFSPLSLAPAMWLDASDATTLYDAVSGGAVVAGNGAVARWQDKSGNARHATQETLGARPLRQAAILNGRAVLRFDGVDDVMRHPLNAVGSTTTFIVVKNLRGSLVGSYLFSATAPNSPWAATIALQKPDGVDNWAVYRGDFIQSGVSVKTSSKIISLITNGNAAEMRTNGQYLVTGNGAMLTDGSERRTIGGFLTSDCSNCDIAEILVFPTSLSSTDRTAVETYLNAKWACY